MGILAERFRETVSKKKDPRMKQEATAEVLYPTGFLSFDFMNGSVVHVESEERNMKYYSIGIQDGSLVMAIGRSGCGKTTWAVQTAANIIRPFNTSTVFHDDIEGGVTKSRIQMLTNMTNEEIDARYIIRNSGVNAENFYERIRIIHDLKIENKEEYEYDTGLFAPDGKRIYALEPTVYILDSVALLMPEKYTEEEELSGSMSSTAAAKTNSQVFKRIIPMLKSANIILILINHINQKIDINPMQRSKAQVSYLKQGETLPGGNTITYLTNLMIKFDDASKLKAEEAFGINGSLVTIELIKSRNNRASKKCTLVFDQDRGFDPELSLLMVLKESGMIKGAGAYLYIGDRSDMKFSQKGFKDKLSQDADFRAVFMQAVVEVLKADLDNQDHYDAIQAKRTDSISNEILSLINAGN